jgi:hypothetical protein
MCPPVSAPGPIGQIQPKQLEMEDSMMKKVKACAVIAAVVAFGLPFSRNAHAQAIQSYDNTWTFDDASGPCSGNCSLDNWWSGGFAGYNTDSGNGYLWIRNGSGWNSWNVLFNPGGFQADTGYCNVSTWIDPSSPFVGEVDLWEVKNGGSLAFLDKWVLDGGHPNQWTYQTSPNLDVSQAVLDGHAVLMVFGFWQQRWDNILAFDQVNATCWEYDTP